jgi:hypothetical protein
MILIIDNATDCTYNQTLQSVVQPVALEEEERRNLKNGDYP